ncbi:MAG: DoxX family protein [actinobacterium acIB-AMD-7]|nr:MAG: DoxX family protein [actinobacterium acIB-AMD-7]
MLAKFKLIQPWLTLLARLILGGVLLAAGGLKIGNLQKSAMSVRAYELLPTDLANFFGYVLPWIEIGMGLLLIVGAVVSIMGLLGALIMLAFVVAIAQAWARGLSIDCGCFGGGGEIDPGETKYLSTILRDLGFFLLGVYLYYFPKGRFGLDK